MIKGGINTAKENESLLEEVYKATTMGIQATKIVLPKVHNEALKKQIEHQRDNYRGMAAKAKDMLRQDGQIPEHQSSYKKAMLWSSIQMNTVANKNPEHIAEMMISGTTMGIIDLTKKLNSLDDADAGAKKLAEDYLANEQCNIEELKRHL